MNGESFISQVRRPYSPPLLREIEELKAGRAIEQPTYSYITCTRLPETIHVEPRDVIIVEGIMTLYDKSLRDQMDLKIYVDAEPDERLLRVIVRDIAERGHPLEMLISKYRNVLKPMHDEFIEPTKQFATERLAHQGIPYILQPIGNDRLNLFFLVKNVWKPLN